MKITGNSLQRNFIVRDKGKNYFVNYICADYPISSLINRSSWEIIDEEGEELQIYFFSDDTFDIRNIKLFEKIVSYCIENFNNYPLDFEEDVIKSDK